MANARVTLSLSRQEAIVLFEWLTRGDERGALPIEHAAEQKVLWGIEGELERELVEPLQPDYSAILAAARAAVLAGEQ